MPQEMTKLHVGEQAPAFTLPNIAGQSQQLQMLLAAGPLLLVFLRGTWCPTCRAYLKMLERNYASYQAAGVQLVAIAHQRVEIVGGYFRLEPISYPYLLDSDLKVITNYGLVDSVPAEEVAYSRSPRTAYPAVLLLDPKGTIRWLYVGSEVSDRPDSDEIAEQIALAGFDRPAAAPKVDHAAG